ncbi:MAG: hypothetical protein CNE88_08120 [Acidimicrobiales bacterium MED-G01]|nr:MAG: hypothetical protein CNE88_08120 [Acidimicrobiales bacterium MED-G01]
MAADRHSAWSANIDDRDSTRIFERWVLESLKPVNWVNTKISISEPSDSWRWLVDLSVIASRQTMCGPVENH